MKKYHHCVKFTYPLSFQTRIPKVDQHTGGKWLISYEITFSYTKYFVHSYTVDVVFNLS